ncbi:Pyruvate/2-oxoglutarate dehydrogenase complex, dihydrolipoamide dehydrogenase (E3) component [Jatrophihabitans endophyticus]|uniref:Pyruvate/2-oxoglutarate dehydrogenase complex, dihydrolipoamide dehydrogenase (E3) component n=1 Tax=Jatrophihabitans endophyticus TaxID=1206085 RepID=A0A1M5PMH2_9ACTN|nr:NAD(P)/FAD-dependent oxidoreductase [Jatrophihabitans endophyticus]SHH02769.1 Pyruvate/2-oxoglutarate dehydrogenase complex, dihydrolipoamide dehydrogenase (E3) component [Jatrophihabitans endophyticus]
MDYDLIVLGLGPGGEAVAGSVAEAGRSVLGVDERLVGGECPYFGCIPSKMILRGAEVLAESRRVDGLAGRAQDTPDFAVVARRIRTEATDDWDDAVAVERFEGQGATFSRSHGRLAGRTDDGRLRVEAGEETHTASRVVIATGTRPALPPVTGLADLAVGVDDLVWTNREVLRTPQAPESLVVLGGGVISCELAQGFARFGTGVTLIEGGSRLLGREEPEAGEVLSAVFEREGIDVRLGSQVQTVAAGGKGVVVTLADGSSVTAAKLLVAAGRTTNLDHLGLETVGLDPQATTLDIDEHMAVPGVDGLFAIGDVTGKGPFTHVSVWQARVLTQHLLGQDEEFGGYDALAWATFTDPEVGRVGKTEQEARDAGSNVRVGVQQIASNSRGWIHGPGNDGFVKVVEDADRGVLVGATVVGPYGGEIIGMLTVAVHAEVPVATLRTMHYVFPTLHRAVLEAVQALA